MHIRTLELINFRNYTKKIFEFSSGCNLIIGPNGIGKTNMLEAISVLCMGKSYRAVVERDLINIERDFARVIGYFTDELSLEVILQNKLNSNRIAKAFKINDVIKTGSLFVGKAKSVSFSPEDIRLVSGSPSRRREYLDKILSQIYPDYYKSNLKYARILKHRNKLLDNAKSSGNYYEANKQLEVWDKQLIECSDIIHNLRQSFFDFARQHIFALSRRLYSHQFSLGLDYYASELNEEKIARNRGKEFMTGITQSGPHRDDYAFKLFKNDILFDLKNFGSRGQQRTGVLCMKLIEMMLIEEVSKVKPILLMDDIFSELDENYRGAIESIIRDQQTLITSADINMVPESIKNIDGARIQNLSV